MQAFHIPGAAPLYTNTFLLISDAGHAVVIDPAADAQTYDKILKALSPAALAFPSTSRAA